MKGIQEPWHLGEKCISENEKGDTDLSLRSHLELSSQKKTSGTITTKPCKYSKLNWPGRTYPSPARQLWVPLSLTSCSSLLGTTGFSKPLTLWKTAVITYMCLCQPHSYNLSFSCSEGQMNATQLVTQIKQNRLYYLPSGTLQERH